MFQQLNPEQKKAVDTIEGPVMVLAGPGTGKTQLLSVRAANIVRQTDLYPSNILILTYTNAGVKAMRERLAQVMGRDGYDVVVETFHSFGNSLITTSEEAAESKGDRIEMTDLERINLLEYLLDHQGGIHALRPPNAPYLYRGDIQANISALRRDGITSEDLESFLATYKPDGVVIQEKHLERLQAFAKIYAAYEEAKSPEGNLSVFDRRGRYDFDDMILLALESLQTESDLLARTQEQFQYVMIDEFQDTNGVQLKLLRTIFPDSAANICVVGDDDQSIYRFQGASVGNFRIFQELYPDTKKIVLHEHYRSTPTILEKTAAIIRQIPITERTMNKDLQANRPRDGEVSAQRFGTAEEELTFLVREIRRLPQEECNETAVIVRTRKEAQLVIECFLQAGIPYSTDGKEDIRGEWRIGQLIKILRLATAELDFKQKDLLLFEILLSDFWQIDSNDLLIFTTAVSKKKSPSFFTEFLLRFLSPQRIRIKDHEPPTAEETQQLSICSELKFRSPEKLHRAAWVMKRLMERAPQYPVYSLMTQFLQDAGVVDFILTSYEDNQVVRLRELRCVTSFVENLKKAHQAYPGMLVEAYVRSLNQLEKHQIPFTGAMVSSAQEGVKILTAHGSKGLEFNTVFIPFCIHDRSWPKKEMQSKIPLPHELMIGQEQIHSVQQQKKLHDYDENRLFYVAATRAKKRLVFTAAPRDKEIFSQFLEEIALAPEKKTIIPEEETLVQFLKKSPQPDPVEYSADTLKGLVEELSLSPSSVNTYLSCHRKFLYHHLLKAPQPKTLPLVYGQCIHKALERCYRRLMKEGKMPSLTFFEKQFEQELDWQGPDQSIRQGCLQKLEEARKWYRNLLEQGSITPLELERRLTRKLKDGIVFKGQFDKVEVAKASGEVRIIDYKTGEPDKHIKALDNCQDIFSENCDDYLRQLIAYKLLYERGHRRLRVTAGQLVFLDPARSTVKKYGLEKGNFINKTVELTPHMVRDYEKLLQEIWKKIQGLHFERLPKYDDTKCRTCPYKGVCWK